MRLGASRVHSFDFDPASVACTRELRRRYAPDAPNWIVEEGSALDPAYLQKLGQFDILYSWGVLHHTGAMWRALGNMVPLVTPQGLLALALYNDQGKPSQRWLRIKRAYNTNLAGRLTVTAFVGGYYAGRQALGDLRRARDPFARIRNYQSARGMSWWHDLLDWMGGLPFEVAQAEAVERFFSSRGFRLQHWTLSDGWGNNEFLFQRSSE